VHQNQVRPTPLTNADDPQDAEVARMFKTDVKMFEYTARQWTENYAK